MGLSDGELFVKMRDQDTESIGLIPAAGKGVRLGLPYPKELYPIIRDNRYKPIAQFVLDNLVSAGISQIVFVINESKHQLIGYFGDGHRFGCRVSYVVQEAENHDAQSTSPGLAHALDAAYHLTRSKTVLFGMADTIMKPDNVFSQSLEASDAEDDVILTLFTTDRPEKGGMVRLDGNQRVLEVIDKPEETDLTETWGNIIWRPVFTEFLHDCVTRQGLSDFAEILNQAIANGMRVRGVHMAGASFLDLGTYDEILELDHRLRDQ